MSRYRTPPVPPPFVRDPRPSDHSSNDELYAVKAALDQVGVTSDVASYRRGSGGNRDEVLGAFQQCQEGRCACPTTQYEKLQTLDMEAGPDDIKLCLTPKPAEEFEQEQIEKCLDFTIEYSSERPGAPLD
jgi:hypothetical protein